MDTARRLIVEVRSGERRGTKTCLAAGGSLRVGRTDRADLVLERDPELSGIHFELTWDGTTAHLRDLESARGTLLSGAPIEGEAVVPHGGWIQAGESSFSVYFEGWSPLREEPADPGRAGIARRDLAPKVGRLYGVLDAARSERVLELLREAVDESRSLYEGVKGDALADVAPYLVAFRRDSGLMDRLLFEGWGKSWGVFVESGATFKALRRQLRRFLVVEDDETLERLYFRFYDPRVLRDFLPLATPRQRDVIFADVIEGFVVEGERGEVLAFPAPAREEEDHAPDP